VPEYPFEATVPGDTKIWYLMWATVGSWTYLATGRGEGSGRGVRSENTDWLGTTRTNVSALTENSRSAGDWGSE